jgi:hypothetical protein
MKRTWSMALTALLAWPAASAWADPPGVTISRPFPDVSTVTIIRDNGSSEPIAAPVVEGSVEIAPDHCPEGEVHGCGHFTGGGGVYFLQPYFQTNPAYGPARTSFSTGAVQQHDFRYGMHDAPLAWLGYVTDSGLGMRVRWWQFDVGAATVLNGNFLAGQVGSAPVLGYLVDTRGFANTTAGFISDLHLNVWDLEASKECKLGPWACLISGGVRYAHLSQNYAAIVITPPSDELDTGFTQQMTFAHNFNGAGPTVAFEGKRELGHTGLALYGNARGAILFGSAHQRFFGQGVSLVGPGATPPPFVQAETNAASVLPVGEIEVGAEYGHCFGHLHLFVQAAFVGQVWFGAGNASNTDGILTSGSGASSDLGLVGLALRAGVDY